MKILSIALLFAVSAYGQQGTLIRVEPLTAAQEKQLIAGEQAVLDAHKKLLNIQTQIAAQHNMKDENWMEWHSWYEFDGKFILFRCQSNEQSSFTNTTGIKP